jgi:PKD repeat protein
MAHRYNTAGSNTVSLTVRGPVGVSTMTLSNYIVAVKPPQLVVGPSSRSFGAVVVAQTGMVSFAVSNAGDLPLNGTATVGSPFFIVSGSPFTVAGGQTQTVTVSFMPPALGAFSNMVVFSSNGGGSTNVVTGNGVPPLRLIVTPLTLKVNEGSSGTFTVVLSDQPVGSVTVNLTKEPGGDADLSVNAGSLTFTTVNWNQPQTVTVSAAVDADTISGAAVFTLASVDVQNSVQVTVEEVDAQQFVPTVGTYYGLIESNAPSHETSGFTTIKVSKTGGLKGKLVFAGKKYSFAGQLDADANGQIAVARLNSSPLMFNIHLDVKTGTDQITGTVSGGSFTSDMLANRAVFSAKTRPAPQAGAYTIVLPSNTNAVPATDFPQGDGFALLTIDAGGRAKLNGVLGDGNKIKQTVPISKFGTWPLYVPLYRAQGSAFGWVTITNTVGVSDLTSTVNWSKPPAPLDVFYPAGFALDVDLIGSKYIAPPPGVPTSGFSDGFVLLGGGNLESNIVKHVTIDDTGAVTVLDPGPDNFTMKITGKNGQFIGTFVHPVTGKATKFKGVLIQKQNLGGGHFRGTNKTGFVIVEPAQ